MANLSVIQSQQMSGSLSIQTVDDLSRISKMMAASGFFTDCKDAAQAGVKIMAGLELGFPAFASLTGIQIIKGRPVMGANIQAAAIKRSGKYNYKVRLHTVDRCSIEFFERFNGEWDSIGTSEFTMDDARSAGLANGENWRKYPKNMLFARAISNGVRFYCPDLFLGAPVYTPDEMGLPVNADGQFDGEVLEAELTSIAVTVEPIAPAAAVEYAEMSSLQKLSALREMTGHSKAQARSIASANNLDVTKAAQWTKEECIKLRDAMLVDFGMKYECFGHPSHAKNALDKVMHQFDCDYPSDAELFEAWKVDIEENLDRRKAKLNATKAESDALENSIDDIEAVEASIAP